MKYTIPLYNKNDKQTSVETRSGFRFGPLAVVKVKGQWQIDHLATGARVASGLRYMQARHIASQLKAEPIFDPRNFHLYFGPPVHSHYTSRCPQAMRHIRSLIRSTK